jgi:hypothetical protein
MPKLSSFIRSEKLFTFLFTVIPKTGKTELAGELARYGFNLFMYLILRMEVMTLARSLPKE